MSGRSITVRSARNEDRESDRKDGAIAGWPPLICVFPSELRIGETAQGRKCAVLSQGVTRFGECTSRSVEAIDPKTVPRRTSTGSQGYVSDGRVGPTKSPADVKPGFRFYSNPGTSTGYRSYANPNSVDLASVSERQTTFRFDRRWRHRRDLSSSPCPGFCCLVHPYQSGTRILWFGTI